LLSTCDAGIIETQTNAPILSLMLHTLGQHVRAEAILSLSDRRQCSSGACNIGNVASRRTLQKAGFVPCGNLLAGDLMRKLTLSRLLWTDLVASQRPQADSARRL
jgi:hypothetical protein